MAAGVAAGLHLSSITHYQHSSHAGASWPYIRMLWGAKLHFASTRFRESLASHSSPTLDIKSLWITTNIIVIESLLRWTQERWTRIHAAGWLSDLWRSREHCWHSDYPALNCSSSIAPRFSTAHCKLRACDGKNFTITQHKSGRDACALCIAWSAKDVGCQQWSSARRCSRCCKGVFVTAENQGQLLC